MRNFWSKVDKTPGHGPWGNCWLWTGYIHTSGYGVYNKKRVHIISWTLINGPITGGKKILHKCDIRNCINPNHLFPGTPHDNSMDMVAKERCGRRKLCWESVNFIRSSDLKVRQLADLFSVSRARIRSVINHESWRA